MEREIVSRREPIRSYQDLDVWKLAMDIAERCYIESRAFPREELFSLTSQMRRSAGSVAFNIAEGWGRENTGDYIRHLRIAQGSLKELETQILLAQRLGYMGSTPGAALLEMTESEGRMLRSLIRTLGS